MKEKYQINSELLIINLMKMNIFLIRVAQNAIYTVLSAKKAITDV